MKDAESNNEIELISNVEEPEESLERDPYRSAKEELSKIGINEEDFMEWVQ